MKIPNIILISIPIIVGAYVQFIFLKTYELTSNTISDIITFLSILYGFYISSLTIFASSSYVGKLYLSETENKNTTLLHVLVNSYKLGLTIISFSILYFLFIGLFIGRIKDDKVIKVVLSETVVLPFSGLIIINFLYSYWMLSNLIKVIIQEAKIKK